MHPINERAARVARPSYSRLLLRPLADHETPASKLDLLRTELGGGSDEERVAMMLDRHVIGHDVRDYPIELKGSPRTGPPASSRVELVLKHLGVRSHDQALLQLAVRHIQGFRSAVIAKAGRKSDAAKRGFDRNTFEAEAEDEYADRAEDARRQGKRLSKLQWAKAVIRAASTDPIDPLYGVTAEQLVQTLSEKKRRKKRLERESFERVQKLRACIGLPPEAPRRR